MFPLKQEFAKRGEKQEKKKIAVKVKIFLKITHAHELVLGVPGCREYWQKAEDSEEECKKGTYYVVPGRSQEIQAFGKQGETKWVGQGPKVVGYYEEECQEGT